jgi:hypothetical protein
MFLSDPLSQIVSRSPKILLLFFLKPSTFQYNTLTFAVFVIIFACALPFIFSLLCSPLCFFSGSHFLCPSTFFFVLFAFPLSPSHIPLLTEKSLVSPFLHSISTVFPHCYIFSHIPLLLLSLPFFLLSRWFLVYSVSLVLVL